MNTNNFSLIMPVSKKDVNTAVKNLDYVRKYIKPSKIVIISDASVLSVNKELFNDLDVDFLDENKIIPDLTYKHVNKYLSTFHAEERTGWYYQQFLKMAYSFISPTEYYVSWDADTIPLKHVDFFDSDNKPVFSLKNEFNEAYFDTINSLFGINKNVEGSFICEHMIFNTSIMKEMIQRISNCNLNKKWFDIIIDNISKDVLKSAGFSEFETYGTYVYEYHRDLYSFKDIISLRTGRRIFGDEVNDEILIWLSEFYDTVSFEKWDVKCVNLNIHKSSTFRKLVKPNLYVNFYNLLYKFKDILRNK